jgi:hypothetical protein
MESSPATAPHGFLSSPRAQRRMLWISGGVLGVGLIVFLSVFVFRGSSGYHSPISTHKAQHIKQPVHAAPDPKAYKVARQFMQTAVLRKHLDSAYSLVNNEIKGGLTKKQWDTGNIPVDPYPAGNIKTAGFQVVASYKTQMMLLVDLVAKKGSGANIRPHLPFWIGLVREHNKPNGRWLVNYWVPDWSPPVPLAGGG